MKRHSFVYLLLFLVTTLFIDNQSFAQNPKEYQSKIRQFEAFLKKKMELDKIPGLSVGFYIGDFEWTSGFGFADLENRVQATENSSYRLASNTKSMTALAALQLAEKGKIDLDGDVRKYVPYFPAKKYSFSTRQLMGHLAGISHYRNYDAEGHIKVHKDTRESLDIFDDFDLIAEPGSQYNYSSYGYNLLGAVVEVAAKQPFGDYLEQHIWNPLGMDQTCMDSPEEIIPNRVTGYRLNFGNLEISEYVDMSSRFAAGGTRSTVIDLLKYARGIYDGKILSQAGLEMMETSMQTTGGYYTDYGMGWRLTPTNGHFIAMHTGSQQETKTILIRIPREDAAIAMAFNLEDANQGSYAYYLFQLLFEEPWNMPVYTRSREHDALYRALWNVYNYGLAYFDRNQKQSCQTAEVIASAFEYFNSATNPDSLKESYQASMSRINNGRHPVANQSFVDIGSYMATRLLSENPNLNYHQRGAIPFFHDYITTYKKNPSIPLQSRFPVEFENLINAWYNDWNRIWNSEIRTFRLMAWSDPAAGAKMLKRVFSGAVIYPDFMDDFTETVFYLVQTGKYDVAEQTARLVHEIYPRYKQPLALEGYVKLMKGENQNAKDKFQEAIEMESAPDNFRAGTITGIARQLRANDELDKALELLHIARILFPEDAVVAESFGEIYLEMSRRCFLKALQLDPSRESSWKQLKKIE